MRSRLLAVALGLLGLSILPLTALADGGTTYGLFPYWDNGKADTWYNFGSRSPVQNEQVQTQPVWVISSGIDAKGAPIPIPGQNEIFDLTPVDPGYSDLWQVVAVQAPPGYVPNSITSKAQIDAAGFTQTRTNILVNCPFTASADDRLAGADEAPHVGWVKSQPVYYFDLGPTNAAVGNMWRFVSGFDGAGKPVSVPGQYTVSDGTPTAFFHLYYVQVPDGYKPNSITTADQVQQSGYPIQDAMTVSNVPEPSELVPPPSPRNTVSYSLIAAFGAIWLALSVYLLMRPAPRPALAA
ncbi:MAG: hypothetical protein JO247_07105 [Chloroflexi bacterium]|nr:hypothetical protein [Chloroflexota bacterium]